MRPRSSAPYNCAQRQATGTRGRRLHPLGFSGFRQNALPDVTSAGHLRQIRNDQVQDVSRLMPDVSTVLMDKESPESMHLGDVRIADFLPDSKTSERGYSRYI